MGRKSKKVLELEEEIKTLKKVDTDLPEEDPIGDIDYVDEDNDIDDGITQDEDEIIEEEAEEIVEDSTRYVVDPPVDLDKISDRHCLSYVIENGYIFAGTTRGKRKLKKYHIVLPGGEIIRIYDLDRYRAGQLAYTAIYGKKRMSVWLLVGIILFSLLFVFGLIFGLVSVLGGSGGGESTSNNMISDIGGYNRSPLLSSPTPVEEPVQEQRAPSIIPPSSPGVEEPVEEQRAPSIIPPSSPTPVEAPVQEQRAPSIIPPSSPGGSSIIQSYDYGSDFNCSTQDKKIAELEKNYLDKNSDYLRAEEQYSSCAISLRDANNTINNMDFATYIGGEIIKNCKNPRNEELCKNLYYKYKTYE